MADSPVAERVSVTVAGSRSYVSYQIIGPISGATMPQSACATAPRRKPTDKPTRASMANGKGQTAKSGGGGGSGNNLHGK